MTMYTTHKTLKKGWSEWISPRHGIGDNNYKVACCDCGLVHEFQFRIEKRMSHRKVMNSVLFRARRNNRATGQIRRYRHE